MTVQLCALIKPGTSILVIGEESIARPRFEERLRQFRAKGFRPVEATPDIVAPYPLRFVKATP